MNKGKFIIEITDNQNKTKRIGIDNKVNPYFETCKNPEDIPTVLVLPSEELTPILVGGNIDLPSNYLYFKDNDFDDWSGGYPAYPWQSDGLTSITISKDDSYVSEEGKITEYSTDYLEGSFVIKGILTFYARKQMVRVSGYKYYYTGSRLFSGVDIDDIPVKENERVRFYYQLTQEWY